MYLGELEARNPGVLASQWISSDPALWNISGYEAFLADRTSTLAAAANGFLNSLVVASRQFGSEVSSDAPEVGAQDPTAADPGRPTEVLEIVRLVQALGLSGPFLDHEITGDGESGEGPRDRRSRMAGWSPGGTHPTARSSTRAERGDGTAPRGTRLSVLHIQRSDLFATSRNSLESISMATVWSAKPGQKV